MDQASAFSDQAARYRRMLTMIDDVRTRDVLAKMADECQAKAEALDRSAAFKAVEDGQAAGPSEVAEPPMR